MGDLLSARGLSEFIGRIYDCALDPLKWPALLHGLRVALDFRMASMELYSLPAGTVLFACEDGIEEPWLTMGQSYGPQILEQWGGAERLQSYGLDEPLVLTWVNPGAASPDNPYYVEWSKPQGLIDVVAIGLARDATSMGSLSLGRHESAGPVTRREVDALTLMVPHLQRAVGISRLLELKAIRAAALTAVLDGLAAAVILVEGSMRITHANDAAQQLLEAGILIQVRSGRLRVPLRAADLVLAAAVTRVTCAGSSDVASLGFDVPVRADGENYLLHVLAINPNRGDSGKSQATLAAVFIAPNLRSRTKPINAIASLFGLTATESRVLEALASGLSNADIAERLAVRSSTVRTHLLHLFAKTGAHRQADLVRLVAAFELPLRARRAPDP